ncbi:hypothetical protein ON010_g1517 [Phytophthora cinnamomi]|nr:hypothetical protein ON010_g1517 [Phytophthora cinnamomi]
MCSGVERAVLTDSASPGPNGAASRHGWCIFGLKLLAPQPSSLSSSGEKLQFVKDDFGADHTIDYCKTQYWEVKAKRITNGKRVDFVVERGRSGSIAHSIAAVASVLSPAKPEEMPDVAKLHHPRRPDRQQVTRRRVRSRRGGPEHPTVQLQVERVRRRGSAGGIPRLDSVRVCV